MSGTVSMVGTVTEILWRFPHVDVHVTVRDDNGKAVDWLLETRAPNILKRRGVEQDSVNVGTSIRMDVYVAKNGDHKAWAKTIVQPDGTVLSLH